MMRFFFGLRVRDIGYVLDVFKANPERGMLIVGIFLSIVILTFMLTRKREDK